MGTNNKLELIKYGRILKSNKKELALLRYIYSSILYSDTLSILVIDKNELQDLKFNLISSETNGSIRPDFELFNENYLKLLTNSNNTNSNSFEELKEEATELIKDTTLVFKDLTNKKDLEDLLAKKYTNLIQKRDNVIEVFMVNKEDISKTLYLYKTLEADLNASDDEINHNILKSFAKNKILKNFILNKNSENSYDRLNENMLIDSLVDDLSKDSLELKANTKINSKSKVESKTKKYNDNNVLDWEKDILEDDLEYDFNDPEVLAEINESFQALTISKPDEDFKNIIGSHKVKERLSGLVDLYKEDWENLKKHKIERDKGFILYGEPGTGKTMLCKAFAKELDAIFIYLSMEQFMKKSEGNTTISKLFSEINELNDLLKGKRNMVLFLDEFDSLRKRGNSEHNNSFYDGFTNEMLYRIDNLPKNIMVIGATNSINSIDEAIKRKGRLGIQLEVKSDFKKKEISEYLKKAFNEANMGDLNKYANEIATMIYYMNGSEVANIVNKLKQSYYFKYLNKLNEKSLKDIVIETIYNEKYNLANYKVKPKDELETAYHEAGHAIMYMYYYGVKNLHEASIYPTEKTLGFVSYKINKISITADDLKKKILIALAGRYAEKLISNNLSIGAISDLETANELIYSIISRYGMGKIGNINKRGKDTSEYMLSKMDKEHEVLLKKYSKEAFKIIEQNKEVIKTLAYDLVKNKVIINDFNKYNKKIKRI